MNLIIIMLTLAALMACLAVGLLRARLASVTGRLAEDSDPYQKPHTKKLRGFKRRKVTWLQLLAVPFVLAIDGLCSWTQRIWVFGSHRLFAGPPPIVLANTLGLINEHGIESLIIDPASSFPTANKYLLYERGAAAQYAKLAAGVNPPLGPSSDSAYAAGDIVNIRRLGCKKGLELGIPGGAITIDHLVVCATDGTAKVLDLTLQGNGTYWVVGRAVQTVAATDIEVAYAPVTPYAITVSNGGGTYALASAGV